MTYSSFLTAAQIHDGRKWLPQGTVLEVTAEGKILGIHDAAEIPVERVETITGVLCPGFVNAHGHLELAHLKAKIPEGTGLTDFLIAVMKGRDQFATKEKEIALLEAIRIQKENGIVALGDIANSIDSLKFRAEAGLHVHTFIECIGFVPEKARDRFRFSQRIFEQYTAQPTHDFYLNQSIVPHAPYSVTENLFRYISDHQKDALLSIHNQETAAEEELYRNKSGELFNLFAFLGINPEEFQASGKTSLQTYLPWIDSQHPLLLVHNTFITQADIKLLRKLERQYSFCLCPTANQYIEGRLPNLELLRQEQVPICLGTDSLASNHQLDILAEMAVLQSQFPDLEMEEMLQWACFNGAQALQMEHIVGSIQPNLQPGLLQLQFSDKKELAANARVNVLYKAGNP